MTSLSRGLARGMRRLVKRVDHGIGRLTGRRRVLIDVRTAMNLAVLGPVWRRLSEDDRVQLLFTAEEAADVRKALDEHGLAGALVSRDRLIWRRIDLSITADAWNQVPLRRCLRRMKFFHGVAGKYDLDNPQKIAAAGFAGYDRIAFINDDRRRRYVDSGMISPEQAVLVGFPKIDDLVNGAWPAAQVRASLGLAPDVATVIYAPTFSTASSLHLAGEAIIAALLDSGRNVIAKLHDRSLLPDAVRTAGIDWNERLGQFASHPRFAFVRSGDSSPYLSAADVMVTDHSTIGFEFALLDRPLVVFNAPELREAARISADKWELLRSMADVVDTPAQLVQAIDRALLEPERRRDARRQAHTLFAHAGEATEHAMQAVYDLLDLAPMRSTIAAARAAAGARVAA